MLNYEVEDTVNTYTEFNAPKSDKDFKIPVKCEESGEEDEFRLEIGGKGNNCKGDGGILNFLEAGVYNVTMYTEENSESIIYNVLSKKSWCEQIKEFFASF